MPEATSAKINVFVIIINCSNYYY